MTETPWSGWVYDTTEADPLSLVPFLTARTAERDDARDQLGQARRFAVALESRLAEVRDEIVKARENGLRYGDLRSRLGQRLLELIDAELIA